MISLERRVEINFHLNLFLNYEACKLVLTIFPAKSCTKFRSYRSAVNVVEGFGFGREKCPSPSCGGLDSRRTMILQGVQAI